MRLRDVPRKGCRLTIRTGHWALLSLLALIQSACSRTPSTLLGHELLFQRMNSDGASAIAVRNLATASAGSVILVSIGRGQLRAFSSADSLPTPGFTQLGSTGSYSRWPNSGTALYSSIATDDPPAQILVSTPPEDEITVAAVTVKGSRVQDFAWVERDPGYSVTSASVTTTGKATLVAFWWGDADVGHRKVAVPSSGFKLIDSVLESGALVQCAVAVREVDAPGTYNVSWNAYPRQGAQLWLVAIQ